MVVHVSSPPAQAGQHATGGHQNAIRDCGINGNGRLTESSSDAPPSPYVTFTDDPAAAAADIAADVAELRDMDPRDHTPAQLERLNDQGYRYALDTIRWQRLRAERRV